MPGTPKMGMITPVLIVLVFFNAQVDFEHVSNRSATPNFKFERFPSPGKDDAASTAKLTLVDGKPDDGSADLSALTDGQVPTHADEPGANFYFDAGTMGGRIRMDFGSPIDITQIIS